MFFSGLNVFPHNLNEIISVVSAWQCKLNCQILAAIEQLLTNSKDKSYQQEIGRKIDSAQILKT